MFARLITLQPDGFQVPEECQGHFVQFDADCLRLRGKGKRKRERKRPMPLSHRLSGHGLRSYAVLRCISIYVRICAHENNSVNTVKDRKRYSYISYFNGLGLTLGLTLVLRFAASLCGCGFAPVRAIKYRGDIHVR